MTPEGILKSAKTFAIVGASDNPERYGYELVETMKNAGYNIFPVNPKYSAIQGITSYHSIKDIPQKPDVVITALAPGNSLKAIESAAELGVQIIWMPPECWSEETLEKCKSLNIEFVYNVCPIGLIKMNKV